MPRNFRGSVTGPIQLGLSMFLDRKHGFREKIEDVYLQMVLQAGHSQSERKSY